MKTTIVCQIAASVLVPVLALGQPEGEPERRPEAEPGRARSVRFAEAWKTADQDRNGSLSLEEFGIMPRIQHLPEEKRARLFKRLDSNDDGLLSRQELNRHRKEHGGDPPPMQRLWELDEDRNGGVDFEEFQTGRLFRKLPLVRQRNVFAKLDTDRDGEITRRDKPQPPFPHSRSHGDTRRDKPDLRQKFHQLDRDGDGSLSLEEFRAMKRLEAPEPPPPHVD